MQHGVRVEPGARVDLRRVVAAGGRGRERAALAFAEVDVEVRVGQLWQVVEGRGQAAGRRIGVDPARDLDQDPPVRRLRHQIEGQQGAVAVLAWRGEEHRAFDLAVDDRAVDREFTDFGLVGAACPRRRGDRLRRELGLGAGAEAGGDRRVDRHPFGQDDDGLLGLGGRPGHGVEQRPAVVVEGEVVAARRAGAIGREAPRRDRVEGQFVAFLQRRARRGPPRPARAAATRWR